MIFVFNLNLIDRSFITQMSECAMSPMPLRDVKFKRAQKRRRAAATQRLAQLLLQELQQEGKPEGRSCMI
jgi:hypothetical protein